MKVYCDTNPSLSIYDLDVHFEKGIAEVENEETAEKLREMEGFDFRFEESESFFNGGGKSVKKPLGKGDDSSSNGGDAV